MDNLKERDLVSVIIPVYNSKEYLGKCLNSILEQTYRNIEIILVDDGSTDESGKLCDEYQRKDKRVSVFHQKNQGQGAARNYGLSKANGKYIAYVDSDDFLQINYIEKLHFLLKQYNADIACCDFVVSNKSFKKNINETIGYLQEYTSEQALQNLLYQRELTNSPWCKIVDSQIAKKELFPTGIGYEDMAVTYKWFASARKIIYVPDKLYFYRQVPNSTMHMPFTDKKIDRIRVVNEMRTFINKEFPCLQSAMNTRVFLANIQTLMWLPFDKEYKDIFVQIKSQIKEVRRSVIYDKQAKKSHRIMALVSYFGFRNLMILGKVYRWVFAK